MSDVANARRIGGWGEITLGVLVAAAGLYGAFRFFEFDMGTTPHRCIISIGIGAAVALHRRAPGVALSLVWVVCSLQVLSNLDFMFVQVAILVVVYGVARFGSTLVFWASLVSIPVGYLIAAAYVRIRGTQWSYVLGINFLSSYEFRPLFVLAAVAALALGMPWVIGFALRMRDRATVSRAERIEAERGRAAAEAERAQAQEIARIREEQTRLARDVHDVVGHSLAVILAQAESGHYLPGSDTARLKIAMANIADSARTSLGDIRQILTTTNDDGSVRPPRELDSLIDDVRGAGAVIVATLNGAERPLSPERALVAYRVLQEMLTNALRYGVPGREITVNRTWGDGLQIEVVNSTATPWKGDGNGLNGMRERLASIGGTLSVHRTGDSHATRAWLPVAGSPETGTHNEEVTT